MARRTLNLILLPLVRFLAIVNAGLGLLIYEEKNGQLPSPAFDDSSEFLLPAGERNNHPALMSYPARLLLPKSKSSPSAGHARELLEEELPESNVFHIALSRKDNSRRKKKVIWTPFGEFTISFLDLPFRTPALA